jgi:diguanylate cyclase (GGDEF)-like protein
VITAGGPLAATREPNHTPLAVAGELGVDDVLVFARDGDRFRIVGGAGRGAGWAEIVEIRAGEEPLAERAWRSGMPVRVSGSEPSRIAGPYWARHGILAPVGQQHLVVFGSSSPIDTSDAVVVRAAAQAVAGTHGVSAEKLLADELELVHAIRALMSYHADSVSDAARHIAEVAARALSCEVGAIHVRYGSGQTLAFRVDPAIEGLCPPAQGPDAARFLDAATELEQPLVEQETVDASAVWNEAVVSRMTLPIGGDPRLGVLSIGHAASRPRGFTMLCQRIGRAIAEAAELVLSQAIAREQLAAERDVLRRITLTDPLTGVGNRAAWDEAIAAARDADVSFAVLSFDLDDLKGINDRYGHPAGDAVIQGAAHALRASLRDGDVLARVGGDEFLALLLDATEASAKRVLRRAAANLSGWQVTEHAIKPETSSGWALSTPDPGSTVERADERMYAAKRRRARAVARGPAPTSARPRRTAERRERATDH